MTVTQPDTAIDPIQRIEAMLEAEDSPPPQEEAKAEPEAKPETEAKAEAPETSDADVEETVEEISLDADTLADMFGIEPGQLSINEEGKLGFTVKVDGEEGEANLGDLLKSYQLDSHVNRRSTELGEQRKAFEAEAMQTRQALGQRLQETGFVLQQMEQQLLNEFNGIDWNELRQDDPAEFTARQMEFNQRQQQIEGWRQQAIQVATQQQQEQEIRNQQFLQAYAEQQKQAVLEQLPAWSDPATAQKEQADVVNYLRGYEFSDQEMSNLIDARQLMIARKAMLYDQMNESGKVVEKKLKKVAKPVLKPGASKTKQQRSAEAVEKQRAKLHKSGGSVRDVAAYLEGLENL